MKKGIETDAEQCLSINSTMNQEDLIQPESGATLFKSADSETKLFEAHHPKSSPDGKEDGKKLSLIVELTS